MKVKDLLKNAYCKGGVTVYRFDADGNEISKDHKAFVDWEKFDDDTLNAEVDNWSVVDNSILIEL